MSMENAVENHALAINRLADVLEKAFAGDGIRVPVEFQTRVTSVEDKAAELAEATEKRAAAARDAKAKDAKANADAEKESKETTTRANPKAEIEKALADAKAAAAGGPDTGDNASELDYNKDVKPRLLAVVKKVGKEKLAAVVKTFGVERADAVDPAKFAELLAAAEKLEK